MIAHCLFEQSGTFKNEFKKLGYEAYDYDILNDYGQTDYQIDLFMQIKNAWGGSKSIFDRISESDIIIAFFPCTMFQEKNLLWFRGENYAQRNHTIMQKLELCIKRHETLNDFYKLLCMLVGVCVEKNLKIIIENPYSTTHYLNNYWCIKPEIIDKDRRDRGDSMKKPTQFFFVNLNAQHNFIFEPLTFKETKNVEKLHGKERSEIDPEYANRFIREFIITKRLKP